MTAICTGTYAGLQDVADVMLITAMLLLWRRRQLRRPELHLIFWPVLLSLTWTLDVTDTLRTAGRILALFMVIPLADQRAKRAAAPLLGAMVVAAASGVLAERPRALSSNAVSAAELGLAMFLSGSPALTWMAVPLLAFTKTRSAIAAAWIFAALSRRRALAAVVAVSTVAWFASAAAAGNLTDRFELSGVKTRADNAGLIDIGFSRNIAESYNLTPVPDPLDGTWQRDALGSGAGAYVEATALQAPHSLPVLIFQELRLFSIFALAGIVLLLRRLPWSSAVALVALFTFFSGSPAGDVGMNTMALIAVFMSGDQGRVAWLTPRAQRLGRLMRDFRPGSLRRTRLAWRRVQ